MFDAAAMHEMSVQAGLEVVGSGVQSSEVYAEAEEELSLLHSVCNKRNVSAELSRG